MQYTPHLRLYILSTERLRVATPLVSRQASREQRLELALDQATLFLAPDDTTWAAIETGEQREVRSITSPLFRQ